MRSLWAGNTCNADAIGGESGPWTSRKLTCSLTSRVVSEFTTQYLNDLEVKAEGEETLEDLSSS